MPPRAMTPPAAALLLVGCACALTAETANLIANPGFEAGVSGWRASFGRQAVRLADSASAAHAGRRCAHLETTKGIVGLDRAKALPLGKDLHRSRRYILSAWIKSAGVTAGDFGARVYFYGWGGEFVGMHTGMSVRPGAKSFDWQELSLSFGAGTSKPIPRAARTCMIRFSLWEEHQAAAGELWIDEVSLTEDRSVAVPKRPAGRCIGVWLDESLGLAPPTNPRAIARLLEAEGFRLTRLSTRDLTSREKLDSLDFNALVLPYGEVFPAAGQRPLAEFLKAGGAYLTIGGRGLTAPLYPVGNQWHRIDELGATVAKLPPATAWDSSPRGDEEAIAVESENGASRFRTPDLKLFQYAGAKLPALPTTAGVLAFEARGDGRTPLLCLEPRERDGSRWKYVIELADEWREYRIHLGSFLSYASEGRGEAGDRFHAENASGLWLGFTRAMVGGGPHEFALRNVRLVTCPVSAQTVAATRFADSGQALAVRFFGSHLPGATEVENLSCFSDSERVTGVLRPSPDSLPRWFPMAAQRRGPVAAWTLSPAAPLRATKHEVAVPSTRLVPLLLADADTARPRPVAGMLMHYGGKYAGSVWAGIGAEGVDLLDSAQPDFRDGIVKLCRFLCEGVVWGDLDLEFAARDEAMHMVVSCPVINRSSEPASVTCETTLATASGRKSCTSELALDPEGLDSLVLADTLPGPSDWLKLSVDSQLTLGGEPVARLSWNLDAQQALRDLGDWLVEISRDTGKFSGTSFVDNRGARGLLGAYEITGDERYLNAALAWGRAMIAEQRDDGGYRMGYGISSKGEACYVADGGEIAIAMARLVSYTEGAQQLRFFDSLKRYMAYRDGFRVATGGIGVGWCLNDYGRRPVTPLDKPTRIFAPEKNTYTIGCTLAAAYAYARLTGDPADEAAAERDADWLMERATSLNGAFAESYAWAHAYTTSEERRQVYADFLREHFIAPLCEGNAAWWLRSDGRHALNLDALVYCHEHLGRDPRVAAQIARATHALFSPESPHSLYRLMKHGSLDVKRGIYTCFAYVSLPDVIEPLITMQPFETVK